jgi:hypothetical protein
LQFVRIETRKGAKYGHSYDLRPNNVSWREGGVCVRSGKCTHMHGHMLLLFIMLFSVLSVQIETGTAVTSPQTKTNDKGVINIKEQPTEGEPQGIEVSDPAEVGYLQLRHVNKLEAEEIVSPEVRIIHCK